MLAVDSGVWQGEAWGAHDDSIRADETTSRQARLRCHPRVEPAPGRQRRVEHASARGGALQERAAWEVQRGEVLGRGEPRTGLAPLGRLGTQGMAQAPSRSAERVVWGVDHGASPRGHAAVRRWITASTTTMLVHPPVHARGLHHGALSCALGQRKVRTPHDFPSFEAVAQRLRLYEALSHQPPCPCAWQCTRATVAELLPRLEAHRPMLDQ